MNLKKLLYKILVKYYLSDIINAHLKLSFDSCNELREIFPNQFCQYFYTLCGPTLIEIHMGQTEPLPQPKMHSPKDTSVNI